MVLVFVLGLFRCAISPEQRTNEPPMANDLRTNDIKFIHAVPVGDWNMIREDYAIWCVTGWKLKVQNIGTKPVSHTKFRLKIWKKENGQMMYSQVHIIDIHLNPQDILTSQKFFLKEKLCGKDMLIIDENKYGWHAEIIQVW